MKKNFLTGLAILLPIAITFWIISLLVGLLTNPFLGFTSSLLSYYNLLGEPFLFLTGPDVLILASRLLILFFLFAMMLFAGFLARVFFLNALFKAGDFLIHKIPLVNKIYKATQEIVHTVFSTEKTSFSKVVLVPFPHAKSYCLGMITSNSLSKDSNAEYLQKVSVFVPGTPNPTMGFILLFKREQIIELDVSVEDALKFIVSCGVISTPFKEKS